MKIRVKILAVAIVSELMSLGATDEEIKHVIRVTSEAFDSIEVNESGLRRGLGMANYDTNRFTRLLQEIALSGTGRVEQAMIQDIGRFGNTNNLPFLYSCVTNPVFANLAIISTFKIEGVTTNSVNKLIQYLTFPEEGDQPTIFDDRANRCGWIMEEHNVMPSQPNHRYLLDTLIGFAASTNWAYAWALDEYVIRHDPVYRYSKRRLSSLRASSHVEISNSTAHELQRNYVTNAINELIAYPESNLND